MKKNPRYQFKHLSIRVPWHDLKWNGSICSNPSGNGACLALKNCALNRDDAKEIELAGTSIEELDEKDYPVCVGERGTFMAKFAFYKHLTHPYSEYSPSTHGHLNPTRVRYPAFSAPAVPYSWMLKGNVESRVKMFDLDYDEEREPELDWEAKDKRWVQEYQNQKSLLNCFFEHLEVDNSLVFFYAKQVPFVESSGRVLIGVGRINEIVPSEKYNGSNKKFGAAYWENMVIHSIGKSDKGGGFLLPYHEALEYQKTHPNFDPATIAVIAPNEKNEFSFGSEHVSNDSAIRTLLSCTSAIEQARDLNIGENHEQILRWIHDEVARLEKLRGHYPGMGAALCAFGIEKGHFVAAEIISGLENDDENPWLIFEKALQNHDGILSEEVNALIPTTAKKLYERLRAKDNSPRLNLLHLLSRFDISITQAKTLFVAEEREEIGVGLTEEELLQNPYLIYESTILSQEPVSFSTIDLGLFLKNAPADLFPEDLVYSDPYNSQRIRALTIQQLQIAGTMGHSLLPQRELIRQLRALPIEPKCELNSDYYDLAEPDFTGAIEKREMLNKDVAYQLTGIKDCGDIIRDRVNKRVNAARLTINADWEELLNATLEYAEVKDEQEANARKEKVEALKEMSQSRFSVLIGPAGTGKTTLLTTLASHPEIENKGVLLLAPTGKARVRMEEVSKGLDVQAFTLAQFLKDYGRYDVNLQLYKLSNAYCEATYETVILDESSMLTEIMLATTLDCFKGVKRFILVGDHRQLPPIGVGRPFVDIINHLKPEGVETAFPRVAKGYSELTIKRRLGKDGKPASGREDLQLAEWFSGEPLEPGADKILENILSQKTSPYLELISWTDEKDFEEKFDQALVRELGLESIEDTQKFNQTLGSSDGTYFNSSPSAKYRGIEASVKSIEDWQILTPVREKPFGVRAINRKIHKLFRQEQIDFINSAKKLPQPLGMEEIVYGDKIINLGNHSRKKVYPEEEALKYLANGEIGIVVGQFKTKGHKFKGQPKNVEIEFSSQKGFVYTFRKGDFREESDPPLELAYALTVHKSQGSEFNVVFLVVPDPCFLLTREMLYTALTRQKDKVIVLYQGSRFDIKELASEMRSDTLRRITNLFKNPDLLEKDGIYLERNLIQEASDGKMLRSKSELLIYELLLKRDLQPLYERKLEIKGVEKLPDFTIEDDDTGEVFYWEHLGMLHDAEYKKRWEEKYKWYLSNDITEEGGSNGRLIITVDKPSIIEDGSTRGAISAKEIEAKINEVFGA